MILPDFKEQPILSVAICMYIFALSISRWNAVYSISCAVLIGVLFFYLYKLRRKFIFHLPDKNFNLIYWPFFLSLIISSVLLGDFPSMISAVNFFYWSTPFLVLYFACQYKFNSKHIITSLAIALWITSGKAIQQYLMADTFIRVTGFFGGPNVLATMLCLNMTFLFSITFGMRASLSKWIKLNSYGALFLGLIALMLTGSRAGMIAIILSAVVSICTYIHASNYRASIKKKCMIVGIIIAIIIFFIGGMLITQNRQIRQHYDAERIRLLISACEMWNDHKMLGVGLKNWGKEYHETYILPDAKEPNLDIPHNVPAYFFSAAGTVSGFAYLLYSFGSFWYLYRELKKNPFNPYIYGFLWAAITVFIHGIVDSGITTNNVLRLYSGMLGITMASIGIYDIRNRNIDKSL